jgi:hypothetical protein
MTARAFEEVLVDVGRTQPVNQSPVLWCEEDKRPTRHRFDGFRALLFSIGEQLAGEMFQCMHCGRLRQWGLQ